MEIESIEIKAHGGKIIIPEGYKAVVKDGIVTIEKEEVQEFKDGDILVSTTPYGSKTPFIFKRRKDNGDCICYVGLNSTYEVVGIAKNEIFFYGRHRISYAIDEEKQLLFDKMKEKGLRWNAEEKRVEKIRWKAEEGDAYYYINNLTYVESRKENGTCYDKNRHEFGNYFRTSEQAEEAAKRMKEVLRKYHEEIGE